MKKKEEISKRDDKYLSCGREPFGANESVQTMQTPHVMRLEREAEIRFGEVRIRDFTSLLITFEDCTFGYRICQPPQWNSTIPEAHYTPPSGFDIALSIN